MPSKKDRRDYFRRRREKLQKQDAWRKKEAARKALWYKENSEAISERRREGKPLKEKKYGPYDPENPSAYHKRRREILKQDPAWLAKEKDRLASRNKLS